ncbi:hypothetical protein GDO81_007268 [Engystomops pustulosus]|uniref:Transglutaminase-like domain-containing protein n=1 Tax=Engystomops pustulosus TaxID=76066 RepID=A0AAV7C6W2_ENGPU|nr:hypothetical protein GDO81_007268 [Engystomops pustulosus]
MAALHERLEPWQRVLLGVFCFPLLPFYLCVYYICLKDQKKTEDVEENRRGNDHKDEETKVRQPNRRKSSVTDRDRDNEAKNSRPQDQSKSSFTNKAFQHHDEDLKQKRISNHSDHENEAKKARVQMQSKSSFTNEGFQHPDDEMTPETIITRNSQYQGKDIETEKHNVHIEREERKAHDIQKTAGNKGFIFTYPWDKSSLKSLQIDLEMFKHLDEYAAKLPANKSLDHLANLLIHKAHTDLEKVRAIWIWICHHIEYDIEGLKDVAKRSSNPEEVLRSGKGVCAGYSGLFQDLCRRAGILCESVNGYGKGAGYRVGQKIPGESNHAWNMVYLDKRWHLLDSTWGAGHTGSDRSKFTFEYNEFYFLTHPALFIGDHFPDKAECQLLQPMMSQKQFEELVFRGGNFYNCGLLSVQPETGTIYSENGSVSIVVESRQNIEFTFDVNGVKNGIMKLLNCGMALDVYLQEPGEYELLIYAMEPGSTKDYTGVLTYKIMCTAVDNTVKIPKCLHNPVGPSWLTEEEGLVEPSHPEPVIVTTDGRCTISFTTTRNLNFSCSLASDDIEMTSDMENRHVFISHIEDKVEMKVQLPCNGTYVLKIYIQPEGSKSSSYSYLCNYLIICDKPYTNWHKFPMKYNPWGKNCDLVQPLEGVLPRNTDVTFQLQIPDVTKVFIEGAKRVIGKNFLS